MMFMPARDDKDSVKAGGIGEQILGKELLTVKEFGNMEHGWVTRGDLNSDQVKRDVILAMEGVVQFLKDNI